MSMLNPALRGRVLFQPAIVKSLGRCPSCKRRPVVWSSSPGAYDLGCRNWRCPVRPQVGPYATIARAVRAWRTLEPVGA